MLTVLNSTPIARFFKIDQKGFVTEEGLLNFG